MRLHFPGWYHGDAFAGESAHERVRVGAHGTGRGPPAVVRRRMGLALWTNTASTPRRIAGVAERAEQAGWHGLAIVDSQNLACDPYVALTLAAAATSRLHVGTGVTNGVTRHPAVTASAIASIQRFSGGRAVLGIGRGDSALAHLGRGPAPVRSFERYLRALQAYLRGESVRFEDLDFHESLAPPVSDLGLADAPEDSRLQWLAKEDPKVPVEVAATGPRVIGVAARYADRVLLAVGADPERLRWGIGCARAARVKAGLDPDTIAIGAYVNLACHPDLDTARRLVSGGLSTFARFAVMDGKISGQVSNEQCTVLRRVHRAYDMKQHTRVGSSQAEALTTEFIDRYSVVGAPEHCIARLEEIAALGIDKVLVVGPTIGADAGSMRRSAELLHAEVLPAFR